MSRLQFVTIWSALIVLLIPAIRSAEASTLTWTATGDDSLTGTADRYDIRWSLDSAQLISDFGLCNQVDNEPIPTEAGTTQTMTLNGLPTNVPVYFGMMTADEESNWSGLSNIARITIVWSTTNAAVTRARIRSR